MSFHNLNDQKKATIGIEKLTSKEIKAHVEDYTYKAYILLKAHRHLLRKPIERENKPYSKLHVDTISLITLTSYLSARYM